MRTFFPVLIAAVTLGVSGAAQAQNRALILKETTPWGFPAIEDELSLQGIPYDVLDSNQFATANLYNYSLVFVSSCQSDSVYNAWNARLSDLDIYATVGGFVGIHGAVYFCGAATGQTFPQPPGGNVSWAIGVNSTGTLVDPLHPLALGVNDPPTGTSLTFGVISGGVLPTDNVVISAGTGTALMTRTVGAGTVAVGTLTYEYGYGNGQDAGTVVVNEVAWGDQVSGVCDGQPDADGDGLCDAGDQCPGFDDFTDTDLDSVPDGCDPCPLSATDDSDNDGLCDNLDLCLPGDDNLDADGDNFPDPCDNCLGVMNTFQEDSDSDGAGDACDSCPFDPEDDADNDGVCGDVDACPGFDDAIDTDGDSIPDACDNCPDDINIDQYDADLDGLGDACDDCFNVGPPVDGDGDGWPNSCDVCPFEPNPYQEDADGDGVGDLCDNCPDDSNADQFDFDDDGIGDVCDACELGVNVIDLDADGVADACDPCPLDPNDDSDGDGVCDSDDLCEGVDDSIDGDGDTIPDACDNCPDEYNLPQNDRDGDGFGSACDCDDRNPEALPGGIEVCDLADNDCNGFVDDVDGQVNVFWPDFDGDGSGDPTGQPVEACEAPPGYTADFGDCDDKNEARSPNAIEYCDEIDNDCDGQVDGPRCTRPGAAGCSTSGSSPVSGWLGLGLLLALVRRRR